MYIYIIIAFIASLIIGHFVTIYFIFLKFFKRISTKKIDKEMQDNSYAKPYLTEMYQYRNEMSKLDYEEIAIRSFDNLKLTARYYSVNSGKTMIMIHGFHANPFNNFAYQMKYFMAKGYNILLVNQRAHEGSEGKYSTYGQKEWRDVVSWANYVTSDVNIHSVVLYGISMGATSIAYASDHILNAKVKFLIMESAFTSMSDLVNNIIKTQHIPAFLFQRGVKFLSKHLAGASWEYKRTTQRLCDNTIPSIFVHASKDSIAIEQFFVDNYNNCLSNKYQIIVEGAPHALCALHDKERYLDQLENIIGEHYE